MTHSTRQQKRDMTQGPILGHVFRMSGPMVIGIGSIISFSLADTYFIGQLGTEQLAAIGYTFPITTLFINFIFGMAIAMSAVVSRKMGAKAYEEVKTTITIGLTTVLALSIFLSIVGYSLLRPIFYSLGATEEVMPYIVEYMSIWFAGAFLVSIPIVSNAAIRGMGDPLWPAIIMVMIAVVNIVLDPILIFGMFGMPELGMKGAAIASVCAYAMALITILCLLIFREKVLVPLCVFNRSSWRLALIPLLVIAIPVSLANLVNPLMAYGYTAILSSLGSEIVAGYGVVSRFEAFALIPIMALAGGLAPLIGQNYGAGLSERVQEAISKGLKFAFYYGIGCAGFLAIISVWASQIFAEANTVQQFIRHYLWIVPISFVGLNMFLVVTSSMNAVEKPKMSLVLNIVRAFVLALPLSWIFIQIWRVDGFFCSIIVTNIASAICALFYIKAIRCKKDQNTLN